MANTIKFKRASGSDPSASDLAIGEPGLRTDTAELFFKKDDGTVAKVSGGGGGPNFKYLELRNAANNGAASFPGNDFTLVTAGTTTAISPSAANTLLVSVSGVIQKPNSGTSTSGITGFIIDGSRFKTATNLPAAPDFIVFQESGGIGEPSDNTVTSAKIVDGAIVNADINASAAIARTKLANVDLVDDSSPQLGGDLQSNGNDIDFANNDKAIFGTGNDLEIFHDGTDSYLDNNTGDLYIQTTGSGDDILIESADNIALKVHGSENGVVILGDGGVELYHDNSKKFETTSAGVSITGDIELGDNDELKLGASGDLKFEHQSSSGDSLITEVGGGNLIIQGSQIIIRDAGTAEKHIEMTQNGSVDIYHNGTKKLATTANGASIDGGSNISMDSNSNGQLKVNGSGYSGAIALDGSAMNIYHNSSSRGIIFGINETEKVNIDTSGHLNVPNDSGRLRLGTSADLQIYHDSNNSKITHDGAGGLYIGADTFALQKGDHSETYISMTANGAVELYHNNSKKFETTSDGVSITGQTVISNDIKSGTDDPFIYSFKGGSDGQVRSGIELDGTNQRIDFFTGTNQRMRIDSSGDLRVGRIFSNITSGGANVRVQSDGLLQRDTSSRRYKNTIEDATHGLADLNKLRSVTYKGNNDGDTIFGGLIAEEVHDAGLIEFVDYNSNNEPDALRYGNMVSLCIKSIQQLSAKVETLEAALQEAIGRIETLEAK